ncbi:MAG TPA: phosphoribosylglycinamide formyltransferase [Candidatus Omnitrophica bacterium]|nr:phosphoribosylglycinamide formyltransferase [Candidatus Omnitrophota bacterium]
MKNIAVFASGKGTNLQAIIDNIAKGTLKVNLALVISDKQNAFALKRAKRAGIKALYLDPGKFSSRQAYERQICGYLKKDKVDLIVLAGFMRILSPFFVRRYKNRILNIHPSLLPAFKGGQAIKDAYSYGVKVTGVTVHLVDEKVDHGPIIEQRVVAVSGLESVGELEAKIHKAEHEVYPEAIARIASRRFILKGRRVVIR